MTDSKPTLHVVSTQSHPQGVAFKVIGTHGDLQVELEAMVVQTADGKLQTNWRTTTPWKPWVEPFDAVVDYAVVMDAAAKLIAPIADQIWATLPTYVAPGSAKPE